VYFLTWRDVKVRYKQSLLGVAWAIIQPVMYMTVFTIVFGRMANVPSDGIPYPLFSFAALLPWTFFTTAVSQAGNSVVASESLVTKVYFPRLAVPLASVCAAMFDFFVSFIVLVGMVIYYASFSVAEGASLGLGWSLLLVPLLLVLIAFVAMGVGTLLAALNVAYRDFKHTIPFLMQLWLFATPTIYMGSSHEPLTAQTEVALADESAYAAAASDEPQPQSISSQKENEGAVSDRLQALLNFNPMTVLVSSFRAAILGQPIPWTGLALSSLTAVGTLLVGCLYFHRVENTFADII
jgi:lipopolysaccharide transport system permease protein